MGLGDRLRGLVGGKRGPTIRVKVFLSGRIGAGWQSVERELTLPAGSTLGDLLAAAEREGLDIRGAIAESPHLRHTLMLSGERCPLDGNLDRPLVDGDQLYLLAPLAGG